MLKIQGGNNMYELPIFKIKMVREGTYHTPIECATSPSDVVTLLENYLEGEDRENFVVLLLGTKNQVVGINTVSIGMLNASIVHPREVFKPAIMANAAAIIVGHNHPSGDPTPSKEDIEVTERLVDAGKILGISVLDHIVIGYGKHISLKEKGLM